MPTMTRQRPLISGLFYFMEVWKKIKGFENYEVSNYGNVRRNECTIIYSNGQVTKYKLKYLKLERNKGNKLGFYKRVTLCVNSKTKRFLVHRLVAEYFIPNIKNKRCVNHIDGNPSNNHISNLEWCTHQENERHSYDTLGKINANRKLTDKQIEEIRSIYVKGRGGNIKELSVFFNINITTIYNVINNKYYVKNT
jgi:hypothetical protein